MLTDSDITAIKTQSLLAIERRRRLIREFNHGQIVAAKMPDNDADIEYMVDAVMVTSFPAEPMKKSFSRLARAAGELGFYRLTPYAIWRTCRFYHNRLNQPFTIKDIINADRKTR